MTDNYHTCCNKVHVKTVTWCIAIVHLLLVGYIWIMGALYFFGITDNNEEQAQAEAGSLGASVSFFGA